MTNDPANDASGDASYEVHGLDWVQDSGALHVTIRTNFPEAGLIGRDSYANGKTLLSPGDLAIVVNGSRQSGTGTLYGLALTSHGGDMTADWWETGLPWTPVTAGHAYGGAQFATGTFERYARADPGTGTPYDGGLDPFGQKNNYPALLAGWSSDLGDQGPVQWHSVVGQPWSYEITASFSFAALNLDHGDQFELWWSMECGNDAVVASGAVMPEPATMAMLGLGSLAILRRRRRRV